MNNGKNRKQKHAATQTKRREQETKATRRESKREEQQTHETKECFTILYFAAGCSLCFLSLVTVILLRFASTVTGDWEETELSLVYHVFCTRFLVSFLQVSVLFFVCSFFLFFRQFLLDCCKEGFINSCCLIKQLFSHSCFSVCRCVLRFLFLFGVLPSSSLLLVSFLSFQRNVSVSSPHVFGQVLCWHSLLVRALRMSLILIPIFKFAFLNRPALTHFRVPSTTPVTEKVSDLFLNEKRAAVWCLFAFFLIILAILIASRFSDSTFLFTLIDFQLAISIALWTQPLSSALMVKNLTWLTLAGLHLDFWCDAWLSFSFSLGFESGHDPL